MGCNLQSWALSAIFTLTRRRVIDVTAKNRRVTRCRETFKNDLLSGDATKKCREFPTFQMLGALLVASSALTTSVSLCFCLPVTQSPVYLPVSILGCSDFEK